MRILLIDDESWVTEALGLYLEKEYHTTASLTFIANDDQLRKFLEAFKPHGVIMDFEMEKRGDDIYKLLRDWRLDLPIAFYTKYADSHEKLALMTNAGALPQSIIRKTEIGLDVPKLLKALEV